MVVSEVLTEATFSQINFSIVIFSSSIMQSSTT
jgi:hypothetical protein